MYLKLAVLVCVSAESNCSEAFDLNDLLETTPADIEYHIPNGNYIPEELNHFQRMTPLAIEEIQAIFDLFD